MHVSELKSVGIDAPSDGVLLIDVFTEWCGPCKFVAPILHKLEDEGVIDHLIQVDLDKNRPLGEKFGITAIPTLLFFNHGQLVEKNIAVDGQTLVRGGIMVGAAPEAVLRKIVEQL